MISKLSALKLRRVALFLVLAGLLAGCGIFEAGPLEVNQALLTAPEGMTKEQAETLASLQKLDDYPLYTMTYSAAYDPGPEPIGASALETGRVPDWGCSLFAALGDPEGILLGRNFDWDYSPVLLLQTDPPDGFASISMVDIAYLGFVGEQADGVDVLPLEDRSGLLDAPYLPFDGMNEAGLAVGMAAVPFRPAGTDHSHPQVDTLMVIRMVLDQAATVAQAVEIFSAYHIDMVGTTPIHYLVADASGRSALIEQTRNGLEVLHNQGDWQAATNFLVAESGLDPSGLCWRYDHLERELEGAEGDLSAGEGLDLLSAVSQPSTQWSIVYDLSELEILIAVGQDYSKQISPELSLGP
jgi:hypothetical protein